MVGNSFIESFFKFAAKVVKINDKCKYFNEKYSLSAKFIFDKCSLSAKFILRKCTVSAKFGNPMSIIAYGYSKGIVFLYEMYSD